MSLILAVLGWNAPLFLALLQHRMGTIKLKFLQTTGFSIANWNERTESMVKITLWIHHNMWVFLVAGLVVNVLYLVLPKQYPWNLSRRICLIVLYGAGLWFVREEAYLVGKILGT